MDDRLSSESYDSNGNAKVVVGSTYTFDSQNQLTSADAGAITQTYDAFGNRVAKTVNGVTTKYLVDDLNPSGYPQVVDELTNGAVTRTYTYGFMRIDEEQTLNGAWSPSFYGYDGGGSVRQLTNSGGTVTDTYEYDAFGNALQASGSTPNVYLYRGEQYDSDLGLYYLRARYYNPNTGRFMSRDPNDPQPFDLNGIPADPKHLHKYLYAGIDPVNRLDRTGRVDEFDYVEDVRIDATLAEEVVEEGGVVEEEVYANKFTELDDAMDQLLDVEEYKDGLNNPSYGLSVVKSLQAVLNIAKNL